MKKWPPSASCDLRNRLQGCSLAGGSSPFRGGSEQGGCGVGRSPAARSNHEALESSDRKRVCQLVRILALAPVLIRNRRIWAATCKGTSNRCSRRRLRLNAPVGSQPVVEPTRLNHHRGVSPVPVQIVCAPFHPKRGRLPPPVNQAENMIASPH